MKKRIKINGRIGSLGNAFSFGFVFVLIFSGNAAAQSDESEPVAEDISVDLPIGSELVPSAVATDDFSALRTGSPFLRVLDPSERYVLRAVASFDDIQIATLEDRSSKKTILVTPEKENKEGLKLVEIVSGEDLEGVLAKISFAGEEVEFKYDPSQIFPSGGGSNRGGSKPDDKRKGPSKEDINRYKSLSEEKRNKLRSYIGHVMKSYPNLSREEKGNMIRGAMIRLGDGRDLDFKPVDQKK